MTNPKSTTIINKGEYVQFEAVPHIKLYWVSKDEKSMRNNPPEQDDPDKANWELRPVIHNVVFVGYEGGFDDDGQGKNFGE